MIDDKSLAEIFYVIVHDFDDKIINEAIAEIANNEKPHFLNIIQKINIWAKELGYFVIEERSQNMIDKIKGDKL